MEPTELNNFNLWRIVKTKRPKWLNKIILMYQENALNYALELIFSDLISETDWKTFALKRKNQTWISGLLNVQIQSYTYQGEDRSYEIITSISIHLSDRKYFGQAWTSLSNRKYHGLLRTSTTHFSIYWILSFNCRW